MYVGIDFAAETKLIIGLNDHTENAVVDEANEEVDDATPASEPPTETRDENKIDKASQPLQKRPANESAVGEGSDLKILKENLNEQ